MKTKQKFVINTALWTEDYLMAIKTLLRRAGFYIDEEYKSVGDEEGDLAIYTQIDNFSEDIWILETLRSADII